MAILLLAFCAIFARAQEKVENIGDRIYKSHFPTSNMPFRILHTGGSIGSFDTNKHFNTTGILLPIFSPDNLDDFTSQKYDNTNVIVLEASLVTANTFKRLLKDSLQVKGVLIVHLSNATGTAPRVIHNYGSTTPFGSDTPESSITANPDFEWNPLGGGLVTMEIPFAVFTVYNNFGNSVLQDALQNVNHTHGTSNRFKVDAFQARMAEMRQYLGPKNGNSKLCLQLGSISDASIFSTSGSPTFCNPLGGQSVWSTLGPTKSKQWVLATAAMDARSFIPTDSQVAADQTVSSLVALLAAAQAVGVIDRSHWEKEVVFAAFQAERYGYLGSRKFRDDIGGKNKCEKRQTNNSNIKTPTFDSWCLQPFRYSLAYERLDPKQLKHVVALDGVGGGDAGRFYTHSFDSSASSTLMNKMNKSAEKNPFLKQKGVSVLRATIPNNIPPSPLTAFVRASDGVSGAVLTGYDKEFANKHYMSPEDDSDNVNPEKVVEAATVLAQTVVDVASKNSSTVTVSVSPELVKGLLDCFLANFSCDIFRKYRFVGNTSTTCVAKSFFEIPYYYQGYATLYAGPYRQPYYSFSTPPSDLGSSGTAYSVVNWKEMTWDRRWVQRSDKFKRPNMNQDSIVMSPTWIEHFVFSMLSDFFQTPNPTHASVGGKSPNSTSCVSAHDCAKRADIACVAGQCVQSLTYLHDAVSPGIVANDIEKYEVVDDSFPIYAEPVWGTTDPTSTSAWWSIMSVRTYTQGSLPLDVVICVVGVIIVVLCSLLAKLVLPSFMVKHKMV